MESRLGNGCKPFGLQVARATEFCTLAPNISVSCLWNLFPVTLLELSIWICFLLGVFYTRGPGRWHRGEKRYTAVKMESLLDSSCNVMSDGDAGGEGKWRGNWRMQWVASTLHTTSEHDVSSITTADVHTSAASIRLNWRPSLFKWTRPFRQKTKSGFCMCAITFQPASTTF